MTITTATAGSEGAILYPDFSSSAAGNSLVLKATSSQFTSIFAPVEGSFTVVKALNTPTLTLNIDSSTIACKAAEIWSSPAIFATISNNLKNAISDSAVTFKFETGVTGAVVSISNTYMQCYSANKGAIYQLPAGIPLTETSSTFKQNAALQSVIYCNGCSATFTSSTFIDSLASDGSILTMENAASVTFTSVKMNHGKAFNFGGAIYAFGTGI